jgi:hypothetical protein
MNLNRLSWAIIVVAHTLTILNFLRYESEFGGRPTV